MANPACTDISGGLERTPVSFLNDVDAEHLPYFEVSALEYGIASTGFSALAFAVGETFRGPATSVPSFG